LRARSQAPPTPLIHDQEDLQAGGELRGDPGPISAAGGANRMVTYYRLYG